MKKFLVLKYNNCKMGGVCQVPYSVVFNDKETKYTFDWSTTDDFYNTFNIALYRINEPGDVVLETIFDLNISVKSYEILKSFLPKGLYRFSVRTICGDSFSGTHSTEFEYDKTGIGLEQPLIG